MKLHSVYLILTFITSIISHEGHQHNEVAGAALEENVEPTTTPTKISNNKKEDTKMTPTSNSNSEESNEPTSTSTQEAWTPIDPHLQASLNRPKSISAEQHTVSKIDLSALAESKTASKSSIKSSSNAKRSSYLSWYTIGIMGAMTWTWN